MTLRTLLLFFCSSAWACAQSIIADQLRAITIDEGGTATLWTHTTSLQEFSWTRNGGLIPGEFQHNLMLSSVQPSDAGSYVLITTGMLNEQSAPISVSIRKVGLPVISVHPQSMTRSKTGAISESFSVTPLGTPPFTYQWKLNGAAIAGAIGAYYHLEQGPSSTDFGPLTVVVRASGPALTKYAVPGVLADPMMEIRSNTDPQFLLANDDWDAAVRADFQRVGIDNWELGSKDSALVTTLNPGAYTAIVSGKAGMTGACLIEVFEME